MSAESHKVANTDLTPVDNMVQDIQAKNNLKLPKYASLKTIEVSLENGNVTQRVSLNEGDAEQLDRSGRAAQAI